MCFSGVAASDRYRGPKKGSDRKRETERSLFWSGNCKNISLWQTENRNACEVTFKYVHVTVVLQYVDIYVNVTRFERVKTESDQGAHSDISRHIKTQGVLVWHTHTHHNVNYNTQDFPFGCQKHKTVNAVSDLHTHTQMQKHPGTCFWERGGESVWQVKEAPWCSSLLLLLCVCDWGRQRTAFIMQNEMFTKHLSHTQVNTRTHTSSPRLAAWVCGEG